MVRHVYRVLACLGLLVGLEVAGSPALARAIRNQETTLVIVPARQRMVQFALDLAGMRPVVVLSCRGNARAADPLLFLWTKDAWQYVSPDDFRERRFVSEWPRKVVLIGGENMLPAMLEDEAAWGADVTRFKTLAVADLINGLDPLFNFTEREWKWLAKRYDLTLTDVNTPIREFNPYDIPRSKLPVATKEFKQNKGDEPPAVIIETPAKVSDPEAEAVPKKVSAPEKVTAPAISSPADDSTTVVISAPAEVSAPAAKPKVKTPSLK